MFHSVTLAEVHRGLTEQWPLARHKQQHLGFKEVVFFSLSAKLQSERSLRDDRGKKKCFPYHHSGKNPPPGDMIDHSVNYCGKEQRSLPGCLLGPAEAAHLGQKTQLQRS